MQLGVLIVILYTFTLVEHYRENLGYDVTLDGDDTSPHPNNSNFAITL
jgi:hypothetical protein